MNKFILVLLLTISVNGFAQRSKDEQLEDSTFAWKAITKISPEKYPRTFSSAQLKLPELFGQWIQKTYLPIGALNFSYAIAEPNKKEEVQPYGTGINGAIWRAIWDNNRTQVIRQPHSETPLWIISNNIIDAEPVPMLSIPGRAVFTWLSPEIEKAFAGSKRWNQFLRQLKLEEHPQIGKYIIKYYGCAGDGCQPMVAVYLVPNNKLPIRQLTRSEVLDMIEQAIPAHKNHIEKIIPNEKHLAEARVKTNINKLREKYRSELNKPAELRNTDIDMTDIFNGDDIFDNADAKRLNYNTIGIYTYEDGVLEKSKQDKPLWICISWKPTDEQYMPYQREIHRSMITHFNFDYVYDYFFNQEKINNKPYTILNEHLQKEQLAAIKNKKEKNNSVTKNLPANVYFFDDFSGNTLGETPKGWYINSIGVPSVVTKLKGETGNWLKLEQYEALPNNQKKPLPENFKMEFDVATDKDFTENTGGAFLLRIHNKILTPNGDYKDAPKQIYIDLDAKAGNEKFTQNPAGYTRIKATYTGMNTAVRNADVLQYNNDFSNKKNKVHFIIIKNGNNIKAFIDGKEITPIDKYGKPIAGFNELPADAKFTSFSFKNITNHSSQHLGIYVSNIRIEAM